MQLFNGHNLIQSIGGMQSKGTQTSMTTFELRGVAQDPFVFRYFMVVIKSNFSLKMGDSDKCMQFSKLQFIDKNGDNFLYPLNEIDSDIKGGSVCVRGEDQDNLLINDNTIKEFGKCCIAHIDAVYPMQIWFDLGSECLDTHTYNRWKWYSSNDTDSNKGRNPQNFSLYVSNIGIVDTNYTYWKLLDHYEATDEDYVNWGKKRVEAYVSDKF